MKMKREDYGLVDEMRSKVLEVQPSMYGKKGSEIGKKTLKFQRQKQLANWWVVLREQILLPQYFLSLLRKIKLYKIDHSMILCIYVL